MHLLKCYLQEMGVWTMILKTVNFTIKKLQHTALAFLCDFKCFCPTTEQLMSCGKKWL